MTTSQLRSVVRFDVLLLSYSHADNSMDVRIGGYMFNSFLEDTRLRGKYIDISGKCYLMH